MFNLHLIGIDSRGLGLEAREAIARCPSLFCTERFRDLVADFKGEILPITPLAQALARMATRLATGDIAVLASGDPLFFGIGHTLIQRFGTASVIVHPALSAMQLAFAHCKESWEDAAFISLHGRGDRDLLPTLLRRRKVFLFTDQRHRPETVASELAAGLEALGLADLTCRIMVAENLGLENERITHGNPEQIAQQHFADLNVMILCLAAPAPFDMGPLGLRETEIRHSRGLITKDEVRAAILHRLRLPTNGIFWDIGAGSGSVSIEAARLCPELTVYAVERHPDQQANIMANRKALRLANLQLIPGPAPEALRGLPDPDRVFIGGSGGDLSAIVETVSVRLKAGGILMASAVTEATRQAAPRLFYQHGLVVEMSTLAINRETYPPQADGPLSLNPITLITGTK